MMCLLADATIPWEAVSSVLAAFGIFICTMLVKISSRLGGIQQTLAAHGKSHRRSRRIEKNHERRITTLETHVGPRLFEGT